MERLFVLLGVAAVSLAVVAWRERRRPVGWALPPGITVFTRTDCRYCPGLRSALDRAGATYREVDVDVEPAPPGLASLPTVVVADARGEVMLRRSGRAAITDLDVVLAVAAAGGAIRESA